MMILRIRFVIKVLNKYLEKNTTIATRSFCSELTWFSCKWPSMPSKSVNSCCKQKYFWVWVNLLNWEQNIVHKLPEGLDGIRWTGFACTRLRVSSFLLCRFFSSSLISSCSSLVKLPNVLLCISMQSLPKF